MLKQNVHKLVILGASGQAYAVSEVVKALGDFEIVGYLDDLNENSRGKVFADAKILGRFNILPELISSGISHAFVAIGNNAARAQLTSKLEALKFQIATLIHPSTVIAPDVTIGTGTVLMPGVIVRTRSTIGKNVIVNTGASIDHECSIGDNVHISPKVVLAGGCSVGYETWVGVGTTVSDHVEIGDQSIVGAGSLVLKDLPSRVVAFGSPAKVIRQVDALID